MWSLWGEGLETLYTSKNVYQLGVTRRPGLRVEEESSFAGSPAPEWYLETKKVERNLRYHFASPTGDPWYESRILALSTPVERSYALELEDRLEGVGRVDLEVVFWGGTDYPEAPDHHVVVSVNGIELGDRYSDGATKEVLSVEIPESVLLPEGNTLTLTLPHDTEAKYDLVNFDYYRVSYPRRFAAREGRLDFVGSAGSGDSFRGGGTAVGRCGGLPGRYGRGDSLFRPCGRCRAPGGLHGDVLREPGALSGLCVDLGVGVVAGDRGRGARPRCASTRRHGS